MTTAKRCQSIAVLQSPDAEKNGIDFETEEMEKQQVIIKQRLKTLTNVKNKLG